MVLIYFRHSDDYPEEEATYVHDSHITRKGKSKCKKKVKSLVEEYGLPSLILCSPFARARETLKYMTHALKKNYKVKAKTRIDSGLGRFFTAEQRVKPDMREETLSFKPVVDSSEDAMMRRIRKHLKKVLGKRKLHIRKEVIWCISHGLIIKKLIRSLGQEAPEHVDFLETFVIDPKVSIKNHSNKE